MDFTARCYRNGDWLLRLTYNVLWLGNMRVYAVWLGTSFSFSHFKIDIRHKEAQKLHNHGRVLKDCGSDPSCFQWKYFPIKIICRKSFSSSSFSSQLFKNLKKYPKSKPCYCYDMEFCLSVLDFKGLKKNRDWKVSQRFISMMARQNLHIQDATFVRAGGSWTLESHCIQALLVNFIKAAGWKQELGQDANFNLVCPYATFVQTASQAVHPPTCSHFAKDRTRCSFIWLHYSLHGSLSTNISV